MLIDNEFIQTFGGHFEALDELFPSALSRIPESITQKSYESFVSTVFYDPTTTLRSYNKDPYSKDRYNPYNKDPYNKGTQNCGRTHARTDARTDGQTICLSQPGPAGSISFPSLGDPSVAFASQEPLAPPHGRGASVARPWPVRFPCHPGISGNH